MEGNLKEYEKLKSELIKNIEAKKGLEEEFDRLQQDIYDNETEYLSGNQGTSKNNNIGNIIKGFDSFNKVSRHGSDLSNHGFTNDDRLFSLSSAVFVKQQLDDMQEQE
ncbi:hypothetical protein HG535_0B05310 [Zygotorulaspora mrakii]|uniref:Chromatin modification-related protein EAF6 n=1 Tax=Zygotorulaspora mrakii TaxID=42260 RepID=A0A7H9B0J1_ZYGMR|nr:uncharacterized protein HG535_0B05310 [Zygotorulaspora mrakii]QLG71489.1 hypothetical protein HG535_0B05310 [Zygotorulaspora mrakii]